MSEGDRAFTNAALILQSEYNRGRERPPAYEVAPGLFMTMALVTADQLGPAMPPIYVEVVR